MHSYEVEIKSLLGDEKNAEALRTKILESGFTLSSKNKQLNHYFIEGNLQSLHRSVSRYFDKKVNEKFKDLISRAKEFSVRTRDKDGKILLVVKVSVDDSTSSNGVTRIELEESVPLTLQELDDLLIKAGFKYQAKWSREREEYSAKDVAICLDKNAGYGWLAEFEKVVSNPTELEAARGELDVLMRECGVKELSQDRLERMFAFYNAHWPEYYGTDKIFTIK